MGTVDFAEISGGNYENPCEWPWPWPWRGAGWVARRPTVAEVLLPSSPSALAPRIAFMSQHFNADEEMSKVADPTSQGTAAKAKPATANGSANGHGNGNGEVKPSTRKREAFFAGFANRAASVLPAGDSSPRMALCLTGGLRSREGCASAVESAHVDLCGLARASALDPCLPLKFTDASLPDSGDGDGDDESSGASPNDPRKGTGKAAATAVPYPAMAERPPLLLRALPLKLMGAGWTTLYHVLQMARIVNGLQPDAEAGTWALLSQWIGPGGR